MHRNIWHKVMPDSEKFSYEGTLVFNGIYGTEAVGEDNELDSDVIQQLNGFSRGSPGTETSGFKEVDLNSYFDRHDSIKDYLATEADETEVREFKQEKYDKPDELVDSEGNPTSGWERSTKSSYLYWDTPEYAILQGSHGKLDALKETLHDYWSGEVELEPLTLDPDFLLYILQKYDEGSEINGINIGNLSDVRLSGSVGNYGKQSEIRDSIDATSALPVIAGVLLNYDIRELEGRFSFKDFDITANLQTDVHDYSTGRIHVKVENAIAQTPDLLRVLISLYFVRRIVDAYSSWKELPPTDKYVSPNYFAELHRRAADLDQSAEYDFPLKELVEHYADLRNEDPVKYDNLVWGSHDT